MKDNCGSSTTIASPLRADNLHEMSARALHFRSREGARFFVFQAIAIAVESEMTGGKLIIRYYRDKVGDAQIPNAIMPSYPMRDVIRAASLGLQFYCGTASGFLCAEIVDEAGVVQETITMGYEGPRLLSGKNSNNK